MKKTKKLWLIIVMGLFLFAIFSMMGNIFLGLILYGILNTIYCLLVLKAKREESIEE